ncbi:MAG: adenylate/guanylate cyclase domain-containing protein [Burkholderiaceae bacterium]
MDIHTENLTILFVDIAGFTATTNRQSRAENAALLHTFDRTLLPHIKRYKGRVVKSIGDALLLTFRSPTDAMLCAMAMQDAMHETNLRVPDGEKIRIRVAANLGEVRVTPKDIFGEPVNVASRIEGIAPADEIYLSEAVFMAMNKAEVPAQEVGFKELAGIPQAIRIYSIPRFATHRLIPQNAVPDQAGELLYPYGGMHQRAAHGNQGSNKFALTFSGLNKKIAAGITALAAVVVAAVWVVQGRQPQPPAAPKINSDVATMTTVTTSTLNTDAPVVQPVAKTEVKSAVKSASAPPSPVPVAVKEKTKPEIAKTETTQPVAQKKVQPARGQWTAASAKDALRSKRIDKAEYKSIMQKLDGDYKHKVAGLKAQYKENVISKAEYQQAVKAAKQNYQGE